METEELREYVGKHVRLTCREQFDCGVPKANETKEHKDWHRTAVHGEDPDCRPDDVFVWDGIPNGVAETPLGHEFLWHDRDDQFSVLVLPSAHISVYKQSEEF